MDSGSQVPRKSKRRFQPRPPTPSLRPIPPITNTEAAEAEEETRKAARHIAKRIGIGQRRPKTETKASSAEVTFQPNLSSLTIRSFGVPKEDDKHGSDVHPSSSASILPAGSSASILPAGSSASILPAVSSAGILPAGSSASILPAGSSASILPAVSSATSRKYGEEVHNLVTRTEQGYVEPWDRNSYYPTVLPLRKPDSGDPELRDQEEFGNMAKHLDYDERIINSAEELGLTLGQHCKKQMFFFKIPDCLPVTKQSTGANAKRSVAENGLNRSNPFEGLPEGFMGKMLVYKSGTVKLKLGDVLCDVSPGPSTIFHNDMAAIDSKERTCCRIGSSAKFATVTPDVEYLLSSASDMQTHK